LPPPGGDCVVRTLAYDIETSPALTYTFGLWNQNIGVNQIIEPPRMICFSARWADSGETMFFSEYHDGHEVMVRKAWDLLDECDVLMGFNSKSFDTPHMKREFAQLGLPPTSPFTELDLYRILRRQFKFISNKLQHISEQFGLEGKVEHQGFGLWKDCMNGDPEAWALMKEYSIRDTDILIELHDKLLPWLVPYPNMALIDQMGALRCPACGSPDLHPRGWYYSRTGRYRRYVCSCGKWVRSTKRDAHVEITEVTS
jgi:uncharacterized protein